MTENPRAAPADADPVSLGRDTLACEAIVVDRGKVFISETVESACAALGISLIPCRPYTPTDKAPVERFFRTLRQELLEQIDGYKGPDVYSRGKDVEGRAFWMLDELEALIRQWTVDVYHTRPHQGLQLPEMPGVELSPNDMYDLGISRRGMLRVPAHPDVVLAFLPVHWRTIQHYGVEIDGLRYNGPALDGIRNTRSAYGGAHTGAWPFRIDPRDVRRAYHRDPQTSLWHTLWWIGAEHVPQPFGAEALEFAKRLAASDDRRYRNLEDALPALLARWEERKGLPQNERRAALRASKEIDELIAGVVVPEPLPPARSPAAAQTSVEGDDDSDEDDSPAADEATYYDDALESLL